MAERMTDDEFHREIEATEKVLLFRTLLVAAKEADRARSEEARLTKENAEKDATIKALADALSESNALFVALSIEPRPPNEVLEQVANNRAAIRLAGRLS